MSIMYKNSYVGLLLLLLAACAVSPAVSTREPAVTVGRASAGCPDADGALAGLRRGRELALPGREACAGEHLRYVAQQLLNVEGRLDILRLQQQLELANAQLRQEPVEGLAGLALLLSSQLNERRHYEEALSRTSVQLAEQQHRADDLAGKLDALRLIEQSMASKASKQKIQP